jgi:hypothetical protein
MDWGAANVSLANTKKQLAAVFVNSVLLGTTLCADPTNVTGGWHQINAHLIFRGCLGLASCCAKNAWRPIEQEMRCKFVATGIKKWGVMWWVGVTRG